MEEWRRETCSQRLHMFFVPHRVAFAANIPNSHADAHNRAVGPQRFTVILLMHNSHITTQLMIGLLISL